jgi:PAS domain-containing protein
VEPKTANEWITLFGTLGGVFAAGWFWGRKFLRRCQDIRWISKQPWREAFGENPANAIRDILNDISNAQDLAEAIVDVICRKHRNGIYVCRSDDGACIYANDTLAEIFGLSPTAMLGFGWSAQIDAGEEVLQHWESCVRRKITYRATYSVRNAITQKMVHCRTEAHYLTSGGGRYVGWLEVVIA